MSVPNITASIHIEVVMWKASSLDLTSTKCFGPCSNLRSKIVRQNRRVFGGKWVVLRLVDHKWSVCLIVNSKMKKTKATVIFIHKHIPKQVHWNFHPETNWTEKVVRETKDVSHYYIGHHYIGHHYIDHNYIGHKCICHEYIGYNCTGKCDVTKGTGKKWMLMSYLYRHRRRHVQHACRDVPVLFLTASMRPCQWCIAYAQLMAACHVVLA